MFLVEIAGVTSLLHKQSAKASQFHVIGCIIPKMAISRTVALVFLCWSLTGYCQTRPSAQVPFAGCYQIVSQVWHPMNEDMVPIPSRFELGRELAPPPHSGFYEMRSVPASGHPSEKLWMWQPEGNQLWISWGTDLGGFHGTLKQSASGEFVGKVKEYCNSRCEWKKSVAKITIRQTDCSAATR